VITKSQTAELLTVMAHYDQRTIGESDVDAWWLILRDLDANDCAAAIVEHYQTEPRRAWPSEIRERALTIGGTRRDHERNTAAVAELEPPPPLTPEQNAERIREIRAELERRGHKPPPVPVKTVPHVDPRSDPTRRSEAKRELDELRRQQSETAQ
jgi:hypothetical protein